MERAIVRASSGICGSFNTDVGCGRWVGGNQNEPAKHVVPLAEPQTFVIDPANPRSALDDRIEYRLHVGRRAADDAEHLGVAV